MNRSVTRTLAAIAVSCLVLLSTLPAGAAAGSDHDGVSAKQIVFVSGEAFLADGGIDHAENRILDDALIVPGGGVAYDYIDDGNVDIAPSEETAYVSPYFAAKELVFLKSNFDSKYGLSSADRTLLRNSLVIVPHTKFALNGNPVTLDKPLELATGDSDNPTVRTVRGDVLPSWLADVTITGFGSFDTPGGTIAPGATTDNVAAKQIVFLTVADLASDDYLSSAELEAITDGYVVAPQSTFDDLGVESTDPAFYEGTPLARLLFGDSVFEDTALGIAPVDDVLAVGGVDAYEDVDLEDLLVVAPGATFVQNDRLVTGTPGYVVIDTGTTMPVAGATTNAPSITLIHTAPSDRPAWLDSATGHLVTDPDNMVTNPDNMVTDPDNMVTNPDNMHPHEGDPVLVTEAAGVVFVMPGDNVQAGESGAALLDGSRGDSQSVNAIAIFPGHPSAFLQAKKAFDAAAFPGDDTPIVADPGDEVTVDPGDEVIVGPGDEIGVNPGRGIPAPERETSPGSPKHSGDQAVKSAGHGSLDGEDKLFATRVRKAFDAGYGYGFVAVNIETGTMVSGYVVDDVLVTDPDRMDPASAHSLLESYGTSDSDDQTP